MCGPKVTDEFKRDAVAQVEDQSYPVRAFAERLVFAVRATCRMLHVHPSVFYAVGARTISSNGAPEDQRQTKLIKTACTQSGKVYGYRKLQDDLCDLIEDISPNRAGHLARLAGIGAQIDCEKKPGSSGGSPAVVADIEPVNASGSSEPARPEPCVRCRCA